MNERVFVEERPAKLLLESRGSRLPWGQPCPGVSCLSPWWPPPLFFQTDRVQAAWLGCPGWQQYKRSPGLLLCAHKPACPCPELRLEPRRLPFAALGPRSAAGSFKRRVVIRPEIQLPNLSTVSVNLIGKYSFIFCMKSELKYWLNVHFTSPCKKELRSKKPYYWLKTDGIIS